MFSISFHSAFVKRNHFNRIVAAKRNRRSSLVKVFGRLLDRSRQVIQRGEVVEFDRDAAFVVLDELLASLVAEYLDEPRIEALALRVDAIRVAGHPYMTIVEEAHR